SRVADRPGQRRRRDGNGRVAVDGHRGRRLSAHHRAGRLRTGAAGRYFLLWQGVERSDADQARVRLRAGDQAPPSPDVRGERRRVTTVGPWSKTDRFRLFLAPRTTAQRTDGMVRE